MAESNSTNNSDKFVEVGNNSAVQSRPNTPFLLTGTLQIILGALCVPTGVVSGVLTWSSDRFEVERFDRTFAGVWAGLFFICTGGLGLRESRGSGKVAILYLVPSIISSILATLGTMAMILSIFLAFTEPTTESQGIIPRTPLSVLNISLNAVLVIFFIVEFIIAIIASAFVCAFIDTGEPDISRIT
ncbi:hypothetical protein HOLleu_40389 [Holothuria leucospilota]|uniref:Uncharacterized protein n=1 Tax=Holothuria leucospilota TaxID=206669 RepID=A0A9Q0YDF1_HOLLE|nr:hypothetical protein HOLleu_40389 [Holothuria leucospilota]